MKNILTPSPHPPSIPTLKTLPGWSLSSPPSYHLPFHSFPSFLTILFHNPILVSSPSISLPLPLSDYLFSFYCFLLLSISSFTNFMIKYDCIRILLLLHLHNYVDIETPLPFFLSPTSFPVTDISLCNYPSLSEEYIYMSLINNEHLAVSVCVCFEDSVMNTIHIANSITLHSSIQFFAYTKFEQKNVRIVKGALTFTFYFKLNLRIRDSWHVTTW